MLADEPIAVGGGDSGPSPYGLLAAALASCTSMTLQMYARRKGLGLETAVVTVRHSRMHAADCESCETREGRIDRLDRELRLTGDLDDAARRRLAEIADRCPVHKTLEGEVLDRDRIEVNASPGSRLRRRARTRPVNAPVALAGPSEYS